MVNPVYNDDNVVEISGKKGSLTRGKIIFHPQNDDQKLIDLDDTVLLSLKKDGGKKPKIHNYMIYVSLEDDSYQTGYNVLYDIPIICSTERNLILGEIINFDFMKVGESAEGHNGAAIAILFKRFEKKYGKVLLAKKWRIVGKLLPNILFILPLTILR